MELNGIGKTSEKINKILDDVYACENAAADQFINIKNYTFVIGLIVILICALILLVITYFVNKHLNIVWEKIADAASKNDNHTKELCIERLDNIHFSYGIIENRVINHISKQEKIKFRYYKRYITRLLLLVILCMLYYIIGNFTFLQNFQDFLKFRPELLLNFVNIRKIIPKVGYFTLEIILVPYNVDAKYYSSQFVPINVDYLGELDKYAEKLIKSSRNPVKSKYKSFISSDIWDQLFDSMDRENPLFKYGFYSAINNFIFESYFIFNIEGDELINLYVKYFNNDLEIGEETDLIYQKIISYSKSTINSEIEYFILFTTIFSLFLILFYVFSLYPFLSKEQETINFITESSKIIITC